MALLSPTLATKMLGGASMIMIGGVLALLLAASVVNAEERLVPCSRARSRLARQILQEYLLPFVEDEGYTLPEDCPLHPNNDAFREQELEKESFHINQWRCRYCQKMFESEDYLDLHFDNRHSGGLNVTRENCLADLCGALHCDYMEIMQKLKFTKVKCGPSNYRNRHLCETLANRCFPPQRSASAMRLHDFFLRQFCDAHNCKPGTTYFPRGPGRTGNQSVYYAACFFTVLIVLLFYGGLYIYRRDTNISLNSMKRLSQHTGFKSTKKH